APWAAARRAPRAPDSASAADASARPWGGSYEVLGRDGGPPCVAPPLLGDLQRADELRGQRAIGVGRHRLGQELPVVVAELRRDDGDARPHAVVEDALYRKREARNLAGEEFFDLVR